MDPGTALGVVSLSFQLVASCVQGFVLLSTANNIGKVGSELICLLNIQEVRLVDWASRSGLLEKEGRLDPRLNAAVIENVLGQLNGLLGDVDKLSSRYKFALTKTPDGAALPVHTGLKSLPESMVPQSTRLDILWRAKLIKSSNALPKRLWWAAVDREKFIEMVTMVRTFVQELWSLLDPLTQDDMMRKIDQILVRTIQQSGAAEEAETLRLAIALDTGKAERQASHDNLLVNVASLRKEKFDIDHSDKETPGAVEGSRSTALSDVLLNFDEIDGLDSVVASGMASYNDERCFVELRRLPANSRERSILVKRVKNLARFLVARKHANFLCLQCKGVAISADEARACFVFTLPSPGVEPVSLADLVKSSKTVLPSVGARLRLAEKLLEALRYTHAAGWLHRNIRSENIVFFLHPREIQQAALTSTSQSYITGFAYARLGVARHSEKALLDDPQECIYRHPNLISNEGLRSQAYMDVYSLGAVLVEIGLWKPLRRVLRDVVDVQRPPVVRRHVLDATEYLRSAVQDGRLALAFHMGERFTSVASSCLQVDETSILQDLVDDGVHLLRECVI